jgi:hypothetical protein
MIKGIQSDVNLPRVNEISKLTVYFYSIVPRIPVLNNFYHGWKGMASEKSVSSNCKLRNF